MSLTRFPAHGRMLLSQCALPHANDIMPCALPRANDIMPCARRIEVFSPILISSLLKTEIYVMHQYYFS